MTNSEMPDAAGWQPPDGRLLDGAPPDTLPPDALPANAPLDPYAVLDDDAVLDESVLDESVLDESVLDELPDPATLTPFVRRQWLLGRFLDDAEIVDRQLAVAAAARARTVEELRQLSVTMALEEEAEDATRPPELKANRGQEAGWSIRNRAKTELETELAAAYTLSKSAARILIEESATLVADLPLTLEALGDGLIRYEHAKLIAHTSWSLPRDARAAFEAEVLPWAKTLILSAFKAKLLVARERIDTRSMQERHEKASAGRTLTLDPGDDGVGYLTIRDSSEVLSAIFNRATEMALRTFKGDPRSLAQRRTDVVTQLLLTGDLCAAVDEAEAAGASGATAPKRLGHGIVARVHVDIPVLTLLGHDDQPATLDGRIPIDPATARRLVADAPGFYRLLTDPITGTVVSFDDTFRYLPKSLRRAVEHVDGSCTAPWCDATAAETDGHHPDEWADTRETSLANSALLCPSDHRTVHNTRWTMVKLKNGDKKWISPCGRVRRVAPLRRLHPAFVEALKPREDASTSDAWYAPDSEQEMPF